MYTERTIVEAKLAAARIGVHETRKNIASEKSPSAMQNLLGLLACQMRLVNDYEARLAELAKEAE